MCLTHWSMVPGEIRERIYASYRPGQSALTATPDYREAVRAAIEAVTCG